MPTLEIENLKKGYKSPVGDFQTVVDVPRFVLETGEQVALMGESGSGKTTFLNLIAGILPADSGTIKIGGVEMTALSEPGRDALRAKNLGYVFQTFNLLQGYTALENVLLGMMFGAGANRTRALRLLEQVGLNDRADYLPRQLSVGQQQRVAVARALANKPQLVLADEPTGNLDKRRAGEALNLIREICRESGAGLLLVSHDVGVLNEFERVEKLSEVNRIG